MSDGDSLLPETLKTRSQLERKAEVGISFPLWVLNALVFVFGGGLILSLLFLAVRLSNKSGEPLDWAVVFVPLFVSQGLVLISQVVCVVSLVVLSHRRTAFRKSMVENGWSLADTKEGEKAISGAAFRARHALYQLLFYPYGDVLPPIPAMICFLVSEVLFLVRLDSGPLSPSPSALVCLLPILAVGSVGK